MIHLFWFVGLPILVTTAIYLLKFLKSKAYYVIFQIYFLLLGLRGLLWVNEAGEVWQVLGGYGKGLGIALHFDKLSASFVFINIFLFSCFVFFNLHKHYMNKLFLFLFLILEGLINGIFITYDLFNFYVLIELSTVVVSILIMFKKDKQSIYDGMLYLLTNIVSMTFFLFGIGYLYKMFGSLDLKVIADSMVLVESSSDLILPYSLIITAVCLKTALMPLFSWLPRAHGTPSAPSVVSAVLSGIYIKASLYFFMRLHEVFYPVIDTNKLFIYLGLMTAIIGFVISISQDDIKLILAYSTVSQIGLIFFGLSLNNDYATNGAIYHIFNHAISKSILFLTAGMIIDEYETRNIHEIRGVLKRMPYVSFITFLGMLSIIGAPFFMGGASKYFIQKGAAEFHYMKEMMYLMNFGTVLIIVKYIQMFFGNYTLERYRTSWNQTLVLGILGLTCLLGGIFEAPIMSFLLDFKSTIYVSSYMNKGLVLAIMIVLAIAFFKTLYPRMIIFKRLKKLEFSFNQVVMTLVMFLMFIYSYLQAGGV